MKVLLRLDMSKLFKLLIVPVLLCSMNAYSEIEKSPTDMYSMRKLMTKVTVVDIKVVKNIKKSCEAESIKRGLGGFGYAMAACSFWTELLGNYTCTIIVGEDTNNDTLGHEIHHCFVGHFH